MPTDKCKKLTINKPDKYAELMEPHIRDDQPVTLREQDSMERLLTGHAVKWERILQMGKNRMRKKEGRHWVRVKSALITKNALRPPLYSLPKIRKKHPISEMATR